MTETPILSAPSVTGALVVKKHDQLVANIKQYAKTYRECETVATEMSMNDVERRDRIARLLFNRFFDDQIEMSEQKRRDRNKESERDMIQEIVSSVMGAVRRPGGLY